MSENTTNDKPSDQNKPVGIQVNDHEIKSIHQHALPTPNKKKAKWKPSLIWIIPIVTLLIAISLAVKAFMNVGPTINVSFRSAEGLVAGKTTVQFRQVNIGLVRKIMLSDDLSHVIVQIELTKDASNFASTDSKFWVVRPRIGTNGVSGIDTLLSGPYIEVEGGKAHQKETDFLGLEFPPVVASDVPGKTFFLQASDLGSLDIGSPIYYRRINVGQITAYKLSNDGTKVELRIFIRAPYDKFVTTNARFWQASGIDISLNASGFNLKTQSLTSIVSGGIAFGYPEHAPVAKAALNGNTFELKASQTDALKNPDGKGYPIVMYFEQSLRGLSAGAPIDFMGIDIGKVTSINAEFSDHHTQMRMRVDAVIYPLRLADGSEINPNGDIFKQFIKRGWRAQMRTGNLLTGQNYIAFGQFPRAKPAKLKVLSNHVVEVPTMPTELSDLQAQVSMIADKLSKFPLNEIGGDVRQTLNSMNSAIHSTDQLVKRLDGQLAPEMQATLDQLRQTMRSSESILSSDAPMQQDIRRAVQQMTRAAASIQLMADYIEQHPESLIRGKKPETKHAQ
ncbi:MULTISPECIES: intermembrane transport protein PqiB [unclassified Acinetobacter]|uniref:PqiB family protein n=1 Tax=unclassified Acinetobacter TaxID=196816 RepID=UPI002934E0B5|nr:MULTISPECIES: MlaD family protein [unclassified Acinetobacter]WOE32884.1 MlaD family protein [Acinetobacter sp. SAAs470]WOE38361.1 MlaD family protein [Acinetobacter sp. SAAs474]